MSDWIEEGKYYRTRDGRKIGPMKTWLDYFESPGSTALGGGSQLWQSDGKVHLLNPGEENDTLVCEWGDNPELSSWSDEALSQLLARVETTNAADAAIVRLVMERLS